MKSILSDPSLTLLWISFPLPPSLAPSSCPSMSLSYKHSIHRKYFPAVQLGDDQPMNIVRNTQADKYCSQRISIFTGRL